MNGGDDGQVCHVDPPLCGHHPAAPPRFRSLKAKYEISRLRLPNFKDIPSEEELKKRRWISPEEMATKETALKVKYTPKERLKNKAWPVAR